MNKWYVVQVFTAQEKKVKKALEVYETINESTRKAFSEFEAENGTIQRKGGRKAVTRTIGGKAIELE